MEQFKVYHDLGARYISLAHNGHSQFSDSNTGEADDEWLHNGLSDLGKEAVAEMNRLGIMIDVSHPSKEAIKHISIHQVRHDIVKLTQRSASNWCRHR